MLFGGIAAAAGAGGYYYMNMGAGAPQGAPLSKDEEKTVPKSTGASASTSKAFTGGDQGFISLKLESIEEINHNTKKFRFHLPDDNSVSGLTVASALITKYKGPEMEKPVIRPYTPVSDEGKHLLPSQHKQTHTDCFFQTRQATSTFS